MELEYLNSSKVKILPRRLIEKAGKGFFSGGKISNKQNKKKSNRKQRNEA